MNARHRRDRAHKRRMAGKTWRRGYHRAMRSPIEDAFMRELLRLAADGMLAPMGTATERCRIIVDKHYPPTPDQLRELDKMLGDR